MTVRSAELIMAITLALLSIGLMIKSAQLNIGWVPERGPGSGAWPFWLSSGMLLASALTIYRWFRGITPESRSREIFISSSTLAIVGTTVAALAALLIGTHVIGIYFSLILFLFFFLKVMGRHSWMLSIILSLATPIVIFLLFEWALLIPLPKALSEPLFYPIYDLIY